MSVMSPFFSKKENDKPAPQRIYHNNSACKIGLAIPAAEREEGVGGYFRCEDCVKMNRIGL